MSLLPLPRLPLDLSTFSILRNEHYLYVDKTKHAYNLITRGRRFFLSRPRRFGKSLFVSTLKEILDGNKTLFENLWIANSDYGWEKFGIIKLDFSRIEIDDVQTFKNGLCYALKNSAHEYAPNIEINQSSPNIALERVVKELYTRFGRVAILIDEYDYPMLKLLHDPDRARLFRDAIQSFFTAIKSLDEYIKFVFITGVSSFSKAGLFSGINNLQIITLNDEYADICGYTDQDIEQYLDRYIQNWAVKKNIPYDILRKEAKNWYNGYHFGKNVPAVYNPFSLMNALSLQEFKNFWFLSGTPTFLIEELKQEYRKTEFQIIDPEKFEMIEDFLGVFDIGAGSPSQRSGDGVSATPLPTLMFQTGYLTITGHDVNTGIYKLGYPNQEVKISFQNYLLSIFTQLDIISASNMSLQLRTVLNNGNIEQAMSFLRHLFAQVPYQLHVNQENFYHALLQIICSVSGIKAQSEYSTSHGRIDLVLDLPSLLYVIEIKFNASAQIALEQIEERRYYESFAPIKPIILLGIAFKRTAKNFDIEYAVKNLKK